MIYAGGFEVSNLKHRLGMRILTWNCNGAFRKKFHLLERFEADVFVIQECEDPSHIKGGYVDRSNNYLWVGKNKNKGLGIFSKLEFPLKELGWENDNLELFLTCQVDQELNLLAVWTKQPTSQEFAYIGQFWKYLQLHQAKIAMGDMIICGDFNSNKIWDKKGRLWNHTNVVQELEDIVLVSLYHALKKEAQGHESKPTFYLQRNISKTYHIDYAFIPSSLYTQNSNIEVGEHEEWLHYSDHMPIIFEV